MPSRPVEAVMSPVLVRVSGEASLRDAARAMSDAGVGSVVIEARPDGLITERDLLRPIADGTDVDAAPAAQYIERGRPTLPPSATLPEAARRMVDAGVRHCLVLEDDEPVGVLSMRDIVRLLDEVE